MCKTAKTDVVDFDSAFVLDSAFLINKMEKKSKIPKLNYCLAVGREKGFKPTKIAEKREKPSHKKGVRSLEFIFRLPINDTSVYFNNTAMSIKCFSHIVNNDGL